MNTSIKKQQGIVLFFSLIVLVLMTLIGVALAVNSTQSLRMSGAGSERIEAMASAQGGQDKVILANTGNNTFTNIIAISQIVDNDLGVTNTITPLVVGDVRCQRSTKGNSVPILCRRIEISSAAIFGRNNMGLVTVVVGIEQEVN
jgi:type IV pilus assembly protein PilX